MFLIMLQVTGHAGGVPKANLERGRSVEFPSEGNILRSSVEALSNDLEEAKKACQLMKNGNYETQQ